MKRKFLFAVAVLSMTFAVALGASAGVPAPELPSVVPEAEIEPGVPDAETTTCEVHYPEANDDYWETTKNTSITASPLVNDSDSTEQNLAGVGQPSHGTTEIVGIDAVKYTPNTGFVGDDSFTYTLKGCLQCYNGSCTEPAYDFATVFVTVTD